MCQNILNTLICSWKSWGLSAIKKISFFLVGLVSLVTPFSTLKAQEFDVSVDYLFWNSTQTNMSYGIVLGSSTALTLSDFSPLQQETNWSSGFRLGVAYYLPCFWDAHFSWTRFHNDVSGSFSDTIVIANQLLAPDLGDIIFGGGTVGGPASSRWDLHFDMFDLDFGFTLFDNCRCCCYPFIGIKGGKINQCQFIQYVNFTDGVNIVNATVDKNNNFWGVGPKFGLNGSYEIGCGLNLVGTFSVGILFGDHHSKATTQLDVGGIPSTNTFNFSISKLIPELELFIGVDWSTTFCDCYIVSLAVGYETQYFWNTWRTQNSTIQNIYVTNAGFGDLMLHGLTAKLGIGF